MAQSDTSYQEAKAGFLTFCSFAFDHFFSQGRPMPAVFAAPATIPLPNDPILTTADACKYVNLSRSTLTRAVNSGEIMAEKLTPKKLGFRQSELDRYLRTKRKE